MQDYTTFIRENRIVFGCTENDGKQNREERTAALFLSIPLASSGEDSLKLGEHPIHLLLFSDYYKQVQGPPHSFPNTISTSTHNPI